jgi:hypothetical protein
MMSRLHVFVLQSQDLSSVAISDKYLQHSAAHKLQQKSALENVAISPVCTKERVEF